MGVKTNWWSVRELLEELIQPPVKKSPPVSPPIGVDMGSLSDPRLRKILIGGDMTLVKHDYGRYDPAIHGTKLECPVCGYLWLNYILKPSSWPRCPQCGEMMVEKT